MTTYYTLLQLGQAKELIACYDAGLITYSDGDRCEQYDTFAAELELAKDIIAWFDRLFAAARLLKTFFFHGDWQLSIKAIWQTIRAKVRRQPLFSSWSAILADLQNKINSPEFADVRIRSAKAKFSRIVVVARVSNTLQGRPKYEIRPKEFKSFSADNGAQY